MSDVLVHALKERVKANQMTIEQVPVVFKDQVEELLVEVVSEEKVVSTDFEVIKDEVVEEVVEEVIEEE